MVEVAAKGAESTSASTALEGVSKTDRQNSADGMSLPEFKDKEDVSSESTLGGEPRDVPEFADQGVRDECDIPDFSEDEAPNQEDARFRTTDGDSVNSDQTKMNSVESESVMDSSKEHSPEPSSDLAEQILAADGDLSRLDDNGLLIKDVDGNLLPKIEYEVSGNMYETDENGRIVNWEADLRDTPENERDEGAQREVGGGGENHGGHLVARMNGGASGVENMVSMRGTINSGDYLRVEKVENQLVKEGHDVHEEGLVEYEGDSKTPSKIEKRVFVDGVERIDQKLDNVKGSTELLNDLEGVLSEEQMSQLKDVVSDMKADGCEVTGS